MKRVIFIFILMVITHSASAKDFIFYTPNKNTTWIEGHSYTIKWHSTIKDKICLGILIGGKDKGFINNCNTPATKGSFTVKIPSGFVSGFGIPSSNLCRVAACLVSKPIECFYSNYFTISAFKPPRIDNCTKAIKDFFGFLNHKQFKKAYSMLSFADYVMTDCNGEKIHFPAAGDFEAFKNRFSKTVEIEKIEDMTDKYTICSALSTAGIKTFKIRLIYTDFQTTQTLYLYLSKDINNNCRIVNISSNP